MILITGATGTNGRLVARELLGAGVRVRAMVRRSRRFWMLVPRLVNVELAAAGQRDFHEHTPALILHRSAVDLALLHLGEEGVDVVAHENERVAGALRLVHRDFGRRQAEDYVAAVIDARQLALAAEKSQVDMRFR